MQTLATDPSKRGTFTAAAERDDFSKAVPRPYLISYTCPVRPVRFFLRSTRSALSYAAPTDSRAALFEALVPRSPRGHGNPSPRQAPRVRPCRVPVGHDGAGRLLCQTCREEVQYDSEDFSTRKKSAAADRARPVPGGISFAYRCKNTI